MNGLILSQKYKDFINSPYKLEVLEGQTSAGKTTVAADVKFIFKIMHSNRKQHVLAGRSVGIIVKNIIESDLGIKEVWGDIVEVFPNGRGSQKIPHMIIHCNDGDKICYLISYSNVSSWKSILGQQIGVVFLDECNIADIAFVNEISARWSDWFCMTLNPDSPDTPIYSQYINRTRPVKKYKKDVPNSILKDLYSCEAKEGWGYWFFRMEDNAGLSDERIQQIKESVPEGTKMHKNKILGERTKATGIIFANFNEKRHCITEEEARKMKFTKYTAGLDTSYSTGTNDLVAGIFGGITTKSEFVVLDEFVMKNMKDELFAPSDIALRFIAFLEKNRNEWGFARNTFIDCADQATISELKKFKNNHGSIYEFNNSYKKVEIIDRINMQIGWLDTGHYYVLNHCKNHIDELNKYSWDEKKTDRPEDAHDHTINASQYAWIPYRTGIGLQPYNNK
ncbi:terminase [uncultured Clostridium sp.]|uniref:terminase n=1 Tax=uncultured Clostridium sp. TaxID=59620 RepID=UPI00263985BA|nr:terminase [uncultured Clostridium sp.]